MINELKQLSIASLSDALDSLNIEGVLVGLKPISGQRMVGPIFTVRYEPYGTPFCAKHMAANYIDEVPKGAVIFIDNDGREACSTWGDILTQVAIKRGINGAVVHGAIRDVTSIKETNFPLQARHCVPRSGKNRVRLSATQIPVMMGKVTINPGDMMVSDADGTLALPINQIKEVIRRAKCIEATEAAILRDIMNDMPLAIAREKNRYDMPWLN